VLITTNIRRCYWVYAILKLGALFYRRSACGVLLEFSKLGHGAYYWWYYFIEAREMVTRLAFSGPVLSMSFYCWVGVFSGPAALNTLNRVVSLSLFVRPSIWPVS